MSKCLVSVVLIKRTLKVQCRDIGYSLAYDYDNKTIQRMTAIFTQYTVSKKEQMNDNQRSVLISNTMTNDVQRH